MRLFLICCLLPIVAVAQTHPMLRHSGLPIPRFVTLKSSEINWRVGPGKDYPIVWVYQREGYPVEVVAEFGHWRRLRDMSGSEGWVHAQLLSGGRSVLVRQTPELTLIPAYASPIPTSRLILEAEALAMLKLRQCQAQWCQIEGPSGLRGWMEKRHLWGIYTKEIFDD